MKFSRILKIFFVVGLLVTITSILFAQSTVDQMDDIYKDLEEIKKDLLKDAGSDAPDDTSKDADTGEG